MKALKINKSFLYVYTVFGLFPILPASLKGFPVALLAFACIAYWIKAKTKPKMDLTFFILISLILVNALSTLYSGSFDFPLKKLETSMSFILVPSCFLIIAGGRDKLLKARRLIFIKSFIYCTGILTLIAFLEYLNQGLFSQTDLKVNSFRQAIVKLPVIGDHPIYISIYLAFSIMFVFFCFKKANKNENIFLLIIALFNIFHILLLASKGVIIATLLGSWFYIFTALKNFRIKFTVSLILLFLFVFALLKFPNVERRFREIGRKTTYTELRLENSSSIRLAIYKCGLKKVFEKPIFGYGWGKGNDALKTCYNDKSKYLLDKEFNSHNQYLGFFLDGGLPALIVLIFFMGFFLRKSLAKKDFVFSTIIIIYGLTMITENILVRQSGIILFIFIFSSFNYSYKEKQQPCYS